MSALATADFTDKHLEAPQYPGGQGPGGEYFAMFLLRTSGSAEKE